MFKLFIIQKSKNIGDIYKIVHNIVKQERLGPYKDKKILFLHKLLL